MKGQTVVLIATVAMVWCTSAFAQQAAPKAAKLKYPKWDAGGSLGIVVANRAAFGGQGAIDCYCGSESVSWAGNVDFGRYFTQHWKAEAGLFFTTDRYFYSSNYTYPQTFPFTSTTRSVRPRTVSGAVTYQFFENVFAHPFVSAGVHVTSFSEDSQTTTFNPNYSAPPVRSSSTRHYTEARPFVAVGFKSYLNGRVYVRSEILGAFDTDGFSYSTARLGVGFDF